MNKGTLDYMKSMLKHNLIDVCAIIEPMSNPDNIDKVARILHFDNFLQCSPSNISIWLLWNDKVIVTEISHTSQQITVNILLLEENIDLVCSFVYGSIDINIRKDLWEALISVADQVDKPWLICGDFNAILSWSEKKGGNRKKGKALRDFNEFLTKAGVADVGYTGNDFTWSNNQEGDAQIWERLDRCLGNGLSLAVFPNLENQHLTRHSSDHCPLLLKLNGEQRKKKGSFKFIGAWAEHDSFQETVRTSWAGKAHKNPMLNFALKLKRLRGVLRKWNWEKFGDVNRKVRQLEKRVEKMDLEIQSGIGRVSRSDLNASKDELANFLRYQHAMLEEKSKMKWLNEGDRNSSFFHASIKARRMHNKMKLELEDGSHTEDAAIIGNKAVTYFQELFGSFPMSSDPEMNFNSPPTLSEEQNSEIIKLPDEDEVRLDVTGMNPSSSPGPDGFTGKFFCSCWSIVKDDLMEAVRGFFVGIQIPKLISSAHIILLPKIKNAVSFDKVRPISLCNFTHKIFSKILNDRLKIFLPKLISNEQSGFVEGRSIHESIGLAHDIVKDINNKVYGGNVVIKLDMSKAYDRLSWNFLLKMLRFFGFCEQWCDLIYRNISNCWYSVAWDGDCFGHFKSNRGVRQGDPLSPSLFILAMEYFSQSLNQTMLSRKIQAYRTKGCKLTFHHLLYADDMLVFSNGHKNSIRRLQRVINGFCDASGQMLNPDKSKVYFSSHINEERRKALLEITKFSEGNFPVNYLGAPLFAGRARVSYFKHLEDVVRTKISSWAKNFLSMSGRATLISSVLGSVSIHTLSILPVPKVVIKGIERLMRNFLWDRGGSAKHHWVNWDQVCMPKDEGGLGIRKLSDVKKCLFNKLAFRFLQNNSIWALLERNTSTNPTVLLFGPPSSLTFAKCAKTVAGRLAKGMFCFLISANGSL
ncbi:hypothetical protein QQ045_023373 [Rhodiola kirilowii]